MTFTTTVTGTSASSHVPTGTVTFMDGTTTLGTATLSAGSATFKDSALAVGTHAITVAYGGDSLDASSSLSKANALSESVLVNTPSSLVSETQDDVESSAAFKALGLSSSQMQTLNTEITTAQTVLAKINATASPQTVKAELALYDAGLTWLQSKNFLTSTQAGALQQAGLGLPA